MIKSRERLQQYNNDKLNNIYQVTHSFDIIKLYRVIVNKQQTQYNLYQLIHSFDIIKLYNIIANRKQIIIKI